MPPEMIESINQIRKVLSRQPRILLAGGLVTVLILGWIVYAPPLTAIRQSQREWLQLKGELSDIHRTVDPIRRGEVPLLPGADTTSTLLEQLSALARSKQINCLQVSPGTPRPGNSPGLTILPVELVLEGAYRSWGEFLGALSESPFLRGAFVRQVAIDREERLLPRLKGRLSLEIFLSEAESGF